ncbi:MAG: hypothetical protein HQL54_01970 [Magnetococcales bacterium]|nr:hypothetical protein [Magnetococcales bacterium]
MNRIEAASSGYRSVIGGTSTGWIVVILMLVIAFFLGGYLVMRAMERNRKNRL